MSSGLAGTTQFLNPSFETSDLSFHTAHAEVLPVALSDQVGGVSKVAEGLATINDACAVMAFMLEESGTT
jgi:hypothetical protein